MIANYHTHTARCNHACGREEEYILAAISGGIKTLGFSDHTPYWFPGDYYSFFRMQQAELPEYMQLLSALREKYADRLEMHIGLEAEYYPAYFGELLPRLRDAGVEYLLLGQHFLGNEINEPHSTLKTAQEGDLVRYCDQVIEAMQTGVFTYLAHPDVFRFVGEDKVLKKHMGRVFREAKSCRMPVEINLLGLREGRHYPNPVVWETAGEVGCQVILGSDAHDPKEVSDPVTEARALEIVKEYGLQLTEKVTLRKI